jgi:hypothetical protein
VPGESRTAVPLDAQREASIGAKPVVHPVPEVRAASSRRVPERSRLRAEGQDLDLVRPHEKGARRRGRTRQHGHGHLPAAHWTACRPPDRLDDALEEARARQLGDEPDAGRA